LISPKSSARSAVAGQDHRERDPVGQLADGAVHDPRLADDPGLDLGHAEFRRVGGDDHVGAHHQLEAAAEAVALDRGDERLLQLDQRPAHAGEAAAEGDPRPLRLDFDVGPGTEGLLTLGAEDSHPYLGIVVDVGPGVEQRLVHLRRDRVEGFRTVEADLGDVTVLGVLDLGHRWLPSSVSRVDRAGSLP
jgi:hypothetical protein